MNVGLPDLLMGQRTIQIGGVEVAKLRDASQFILQIFGKDGKWHGFKKFDAKGIKIGSRERSDRFPALRTMAAKHLRLTPEGSKLLVQDLGSLNGVFRMIKEPQPLVDGTQFRVGQYLIEFRLAKPAPDVAPDSKDGEQLCCVDPVVPAFLVFIRPSGEEGLRFPLTKTETVLGQERAYESAPIDLHLPADSTSGRHAKIVRGNSRFFLENLSQTTGTFVKIQGDDQIKIGEEILAGQVKFRVIEDKI